jgi:hypothetical protein
MTSTQAKILLELLETHWMDARDIAEDYGLELDDLHELKGFLTGMSLDINPNLIPADHDQ